MRWRAPRLHHASPPDQPVEGPGSRPSEHCVKNALVIAAPFGFGPASKAIHIARTLAPSLSVTILSAGDAHRFVTRHAPAGTVCRAGTLAAVFSVQDLAAFDLIVCVDNAPAARYLSRSGLGERVVFVDDLLQWRVGLDELQNERPIRAYLVQDFPGLDSTCRPATPGRSNWWHPWCGAAGGRPCRPRNGRA